MWKVVFESKARIEFEDAYYWYESASNGLGERFENAINERINNILVDPFQFQNKIKTYREVVLSVFPFIIIYFIDEPENTIVIISVFHTSRNPNKKYLD